MRWQDASIMEQWTSNSLWTKIMFGNAVCFSRFRGNWTAVWWTAENDHRVHRVQWAFDVHLVNMGGPADTGAPTSFPQFTVTCTRKCSLRLSEMVIRVMTNDCRQCKFLMKTIIPFDGLMCAGMVSLAKDMWSSIKISEQMSLHNGTPRNYSNSNCWLPCFRESHFCTVQLERVKTMSPFADLLFLSKNSQTFCESSCSKIFAYACQAQSKAK